MVIERLFASPRRSYRSSPENPSTNLSDPDSWLIDYMNGGPTASGTRVNAQTAIRVVTIRTCIVILSSTIASLPLILYRRTKNNGRERATEHPAYRIMHSLPNPNHTSYTFRSVVEANRNIYGDGFAQAIYANNNRLVAVNPLQSGSVSVESVGGNMRYTYTTGKGSRIIPPDEVLHFPGLNFDGVRSQSPIDTCRDAIGLAMATEEFASRYFSNGHAWGGVLEHPGALDADGMQNLRESMAKRGQGLGNAHNPLILEEGMKWKSSINNPEESQALETREALVREMCRIYRIPTHFVAVEHSEPRSNVEQESLEFVIYTMQPIAVLWEQELNRKLLTASEQDDYYFEFNFDGLLRGDSKTRSEVLVSKVNNGLMTRNEARAIDNMAGIDGADELTAQSAMVPLSMLGQNAKPVDSPEPPDPEEEPKAERDLSFLRPTFRAAFQRLAEKEQNAIDAARKKAEKKGEDYYVWVKKFYGDHVAAVRMVLMPLVETVGQLHTWAPEKISSTVETWSARYVFEAVEDAKWTEPERIRERADAALQEVANGT